MANWYTYISGDPRVASSYYYTDVKPMCTTGVQLCAVYLQDPSTTVPAQVNLDPELLNISNALMTQVPQPNGVGIKALVYLKCNC